MFIKALECHPDPLYYLYTGAALHELCRYEEAVAYYDKALALAPGYGEAHNNRGNSLIALRRNQEAVEAYSAAAACLPSSPVPLSAQATALQALGRLQEAEECCRRALQIDAEFPEAHWNLALNLLLQGRYREGWPEYEWRWRRPGFTSPRRHQDVPQWHGGRLDGKTILLHAEQGFGDAIQFIRYAPLVAARGAKVIIECHPPLVRIFSTIPSVALVTSFGSDLPHFDCHCPLLSLPGIFHTEVDSIPSRVPYLAPDTDDLIRWTHLLGKSRGLTIGLVWAGKPYPDPLRSCSLEDFAALNAAADCTFVSLQIGSESCQAATAPAGMKLLDPSGHIRDFADTAALISRLDLVITIDTAVAHLAGALAKPVWTLLPLAPDWRWLLNREDCPWYPSMRLFRQTTDGSWHEPLQKAAVMLQHLSKM